MSLIRHLSFLFTSQHPRTISYICKPPSPVQKLKILDISFSSRTVFHLEWRTQDPPYQILLSRTLHQKLMIQKCRDHTVSVLAQVDSVVVLANTYQRQQRQIFCPCSRLDAGASPVAQFSSVQFSCLVMSDSLQTHGLQHSRPPCPSPTPGAYSNSCTSLISANQSM